jgi:hypothetical protein
MGASGEYKPSAVVAVHNGRHPRQERARAKGFSGCCVGCSAQQPTVRLSRGLPPVSGARLLMTLIALGSDVGPQGTSLLT